MNPIEQKYGVGQDRVCMWCRKQHDSVCCICHKPTVTDKFAATSVHGKCIGDLGKAEVR